MRKIVYKSVFVYLYEVEDQLKYLLLNTMANIISLKVVSNYKNWTKISENLFVLSIQILGNVIHSIRLKISSQDSENF